MVDHPAPILAALFGAGVLLLTLGHRLAHPHPKELR